MREMTSALSFNASLNGPSAFSASYLSELHLSAIKSSGVESSRTGVRRGGAEREICQQILAHSRISDRGLMDVVEGPKHK